MGPVGRLLILSTVIFSKYLCLDICPALESPETSDPSVTPFQEGGLSPEKCPEDKPGSGPGRLGKGINLC
jgi:hypothetical protein